MDKTDDLNNINPHPAYAEGQKQPLSPSASDEFDDEDEDEDDDIPLKDDNLANASPERVKHYVAYTIKLPSDQLSALQSIWLELKKLYGSHSPDKSGMIQAAIDSWLKRWDGPDREKLLQELLDIRQSTRRRQYRKK